MFGPCTVLKNADGWMKTAIPPRTYGVYFNKAIHGRVASISSFDGKPLHSAEKTAM